MRRFKETRQIFELIRQSDIVLEVIDGRLPTLTRVSSIENQLIQEEIPFIIVLNKCDLVPRNICERNTKILNKEHPTVYISTQQRQGTLILRKKINELSCKHETFVSIVGTPNTGKSSLLNVLRGKHVAATGQKPGLTRHLQLVRISRNIVIYDTPGIVPFDFQDPELRVFLGADPIEKIEDPIKTAIFFINRIKKFNSNGFRQRYSLDNLEIDSEEIITQIAKNRGLLHKGGKFNVIEGAKILMREFTAGLFPYWEPLNS